MPFSAPHTDRAHLGYNSRTKYFHEWLETAPIVWEAYGLSREHRGDFSRMSQFWANQIAKRIFLQRSIEARLNASDADPVSQLLGPELQFALNDLATSPYAPTVRVQSPWLVHDLSMATVDKLHSNQIVG